jgi:hypothetical protein
VFSGSKATRSVNSTEVSFADELAEVFSTNEALSNFESITDMTITGTTKRDDNVPSMISQASIAGLNFNGTSLDAVMALFDNGDGHFFVAPSSDSTDERLAKRHDGAGFKVSCKSIICSVIQSNVI